MAAGQYFVPVPKAVWEKRKWVAPALQFPIDAVQVVVDPIPSIIDKLIQEGVSPEGEAVFYYALKHKDEALVSILGPMTRKAPGALASLVAVNDQEGAALEPGHRIGYTIPGSTLTWRIKKVGEEGYVDVEAWMRGEAPKTLIRESTPGAEHKDGGSWGTLLALGAAYFLLEGK